MAVTRVITIKGDTKQAQQSFENLGDVIQEQKDITIEFEQELIRLQNQLARTSNKDLNRQRDLRKEILHVKSAVKEQKIAVKDLTNQQSKVSKATDGATKSVAKNYGAIQLLDQVTGGLATQYRSVVDASRLFNASLLKTRALLIATGIGAFVVVLGLVVAYWSDIVEFITGANEKLQEQIDLQNDIVKDLEFELELLELKEKVLVVEGKSTEETKNQRRRIIELLIIENDVLLRKLQTQLLIEQSKARELGFFEKVENLLVGSLFGGGIKVIGDIDDEEKSTIDEIEQGLRDSLLSAEKLKLSLIEINKPEEVRGEDQERAEVLPTTGVSLSELETLGQQEFDALSLQQTARINLEDASAERRKEIARLEAEAKIESLFLVADAFAVASDLIGKETAAGKAFSVASTLISTYLAAQQAYASQLAIPTPDAPLRAALAAGVAVASGLANVKQILSVKVPGQGGGGNVGGTPSTPPSFNVVANSPQNQLNQALLENNNEPVEAFVVEKTVTTAEELRRNKVEASSF